MFQMLQTLPLPVRLQLKKALAPECGAAANRESSHTLFYLISFISSQRAIRTHIT
jgi:hypothetical protein